MTKIDKSYLEKLGEILYDEKKAMNYKTVSIAIGVHVNIAKQMMYHMYKSAKSEGKQIYATYYVSGMVPRRVLTNSGSNGQGRNGDDSTSEQPPMDHLEAYLVSICREKDLEDIKSKYTKIFSVHIYSLSSFAIENSDVLENLVEYPLRDNEGRTPVDFGPIISSASQKLKETSKITRIVPNPNILSKSKSDQVNKGMNFSKTPETTNGLSNNGNGSTEDSQEIKSQQKLAKPATIEKKDGNRLKSMFATASSKPKSQPKKSESVKPDIRKVKEDPNVDTKAESKSVSSRSKDKETRKRKRIRDVLSSDSEEDEKISENEEDSSSESTIPRKRIQIESDSDDDFKETPKTKADDPPSSDTKNAVPGRKRVAKMVSKTYVNKDGYLVTTKEQVMVSEDEDDQGDKKESKRLDLATSKSSSNESASKKPTDATPLKSNSSGKTAGGKTKQPSLMSFFQKK